MKPDEFPTLNEGKERNEEIALDFAALVKDFKTWKLPFMCIGIYATENDQEIKCTLAQNIKRDVRPSREDIYKITTQNDEDLHALEPLRKALEEKGFFVTLEEKPDFLAGTIKSESRSDLFTSGTIVERDPVKLQKDKSNEAFDRAHKISHESYKKDVETSGARIVFPDFLEELEIRQDKQFWYFKHTKCGTVVTVFAEFMPSRIATIVNAHFPCDGSSK